MESLEHIQKQLAGLEELRDIVKTMKALSAASVRQYEHAAKALEDYYRTVELGLHAALRGADIAEVAAVRRHAKRSAVGLVVFGSDHGLCGRFNEEVVSHAIEYLQELCSPKDRCRVLAVGARAAGGLEVAGLSVVDLMVPGSAARITSVVHKILYQIDAWREADAAMPVALVYNHPLRRNTSYRPVSLPLLPIDLRRFKDLEAEPWPSRGVPGFSLPRSALMTHLLRQYFFVAISRACAESQAAEHGSRLVAMQAAEKNLAERLDEVTLHYRRARQGVITAELLDVVSGFEAITRDPLADSRREADSGDASRAGKGRTRTANA